MVDIPEAELRDLYENRRLSSLYIAQHYKCSDSTIRNKLRKYHIPIRDLGVPRQVIISHLELEHLYLTDGLTVAEIAAHYHCSQGTVGARLAEYGIPIRPPGRIRVNITTEQLQEYYIDEKLSLRQIAQIIDCDPTTIKNKMRQLGISTRSYAEANTVYPKRDYDGTPADKAYLQGFRLGDMNVVVFSKDGQTLDINSGSTIPDQIQLITDLFEPYGHVYICIKKNGESGIHCYVNRSFEFLLPKEDAVPTWVQDSPQASVAFAAGYIDAEGSFFIYSSCNTGHFSIGSYDANILKWMYNWLNAQDIRAKLYMAGRAGQVRPSGRSYKKDYWSLRVNCKDSLLKLIALLEPYLKHAKRRAAMERVKQNTLARIK